MSLFGLLENYWLDSEKCYTCCKTLKTMIQNLEGQRKAPYKGEQLLMVEPWMLDRVFKLDSALLNRMELLFDQDFKSVRIHVGPHAASLTSQKGAEALTIGSDIYFAEGLYDPYSEEGMKLIAHELVHVVQFHQGYGPGNDEDRASLEGAAYRMEKMINDYFHNLSSGSLDEEFSNSFSQRNRAGALSRNDREGSGLLENFAAEDRIKDIEVVMESTGCRYILSKEDVDRAKSQAVDSFKKDLEDQYNLSTRDEKIELMEQLRAKDYLR